LEHQSPTQHNLKNAHVPKRCVYAYQKLNKIKALERELFLICFPQIKLLYLQLQT